MDCYLALRGLKTLAIRMRAHCAGARAIAGYLQTHPDVTTVHYPGLSDDPGHALASRQSRSCRSKMDSGVEAFNVPGSVRVTVELIKWKRQMDWNVWTKTSEPPRSRTPSFSRRACRAVGAAYHPDLYCTL